MTALISRRVAHRRLPRAAVGLVVALATVAACSPATSAARTPDRLLYGVQVGAPTEPDLRRLADGGGEVIRLPVGWHDVQREANGPYDWTVPDREMATAARAGLRILPVVVGSPAFAAPITTEQPQSPEALAAYKRYIHALFERYGAGSPFWGAVGAASSAPVAAWQIWNEPHDDRFWAGKPSARKYARFLQLTRSVAAEADPSAQFMLAGISEHNNRGPVDRWLEDIYRVPGIRRDFDIVAVNPYAAKLADVEDAVRRARQVMDRNGDRGTPLWVTEIGWATAGPDRNDLRVSQEDQARLLRQSFALLGRRVSRYRLEAILWFNWRDRTVPTGEPDRIDAHMGLFRVDGSPKPAWRSFVEATGGVAGSGRLSPPP